MVPGDLQADLLEIPASSLGIESLNAKQTSCVLSLQLTWKVTFLQMHFENKLYVAPVPLKLSSIHTVPIWIFFFKGFLITDSQIALG